MDAPVRILALSACILLFYVSRLNASCQISYGRRGCKDRVHNGVLAKCMGDSAKMLPASVPQDTVWLELVDFQFGKFTRDDFRRIRNVECLIIRDSGIRSIAYDAFSELELLNEVDFDNTNLTTDDIKFVNHPDFQARVVSFTGSTHVNHLRFNGTAALQKLTEVHLENNRIQYIEPSIISNLLITEKLSLSNNDLEALDWNRLTNMAKLNMLALDGNKIQSIPATVLPVFSAVKELRLGGNPLHCNCKLRWLKEFYDITGDKQLDYEDVWCASPFHRRMQDTTVEDFSCDNPSPPRVEWKEVGAEYIVNCSSESDPAPTLTISLPDDMLIHTPPTGNLAKLITKSPRVVIGPGAVVCEARNSEGVSVTVEYVPFEGYVNSSPRHVACSYIIAWICLVVTLTIAPLMNC